MQKQVDAGITYQTAAIGEKLKEMSVQFWFMKEQAQTSDYTLFQLAQGQQTYMTMGVSKEVLFC